MSESLLFCTNNKHHENIKIPDVMWVSTHLFFCEDDAAEQLLLQTSHSDCEVDNSCAGADLRSVRWIGQLGGHIKPEPLHHIHLFISDFYLF